MIDFFRNLRISSSSFWLGFISGILSAWILSRLWVFIPKIIQFFRHKMGNIKENLSVGTEVHLRNDIYRFTQKQHLASSFFSLSEIVIEPKVLTPMVQSSISTENAPTDSVSLTVPYIPDWPDFGAAYNASTLQLIDALQGGASIILAGHPGSGKSVALAWLASVIARNDKGLGNLTGLLPLYVHATNFHRLFDQLDNKSDDPVEEILITPENQKQSTIRIKDANEAINVITQAISTYVSPITLPKLFQVIQVAVESQRAILILDRVDELPPNQASAVTELLRVLQEKYPKLRVVIAMSYDNLAGLPTLGYSLLGLAAWGDVERARLLQRWGKQWVKWINPVDKSQSKKINSYYLKSWLSENNDLLKPLEYTLKLWAGFAGDSIGTDGPSAIEAYIRRMTKDIKDVRPGLERFSLQLLFEMKVLSNPFDLNWLKTNDTTAEKSSDVGGSLNSSLHSLSISHLQNKEIPGIDSLSNNGFLVSYPGSCYGFSHPMFCGYLAGIALSETNVLEKLQDQPSWTAKQLALYYLARDGDVTPLIQYYLNEDDILHTNHLEISRWLQIAPKNRPWRSIILRTLTTILQKERDTLSLAAKIIAAMAYSGDSGVAIYFRQLLKSDHPNLKQLAALGCGLLADKKAIEDLSSMLQESSPTSVRGACLALAAIGDKQSLEILAASLVNGDEQTRRYAAEALANNSQEGHPALQEGSGMEDVLVRRSVVFGLIRIDQPWARKIVENMQLEDKEWVVRTAAIQAFEELQQKSNYAPKPLPDLTETQWLIEYAAKIGTTVAPGKPGEELVNKALLSGSQDEKLFAMNYYRNKCDPKSVSFISSAYSTSSGELREAIYYVLWLMTIAGIKLPYSFE
jgi:HEAT repeat protein